MKVLKFGGSSVGTPERIRVVKRIVEAQSLPCVVVVSAFQGVTDQLHKIAELAASGSTESWDLLGKLTALHRETTATLITDKVKRDETLKYVDDILNELTETCTGIFLLHEITRHSLDNVLATGERLSSRIINGYLGNSIYVDARDLIKIDAKSWKQFC